MDELDMPPAPPMPLPLLAGVPLLEPLWSQAAAVTVSESPSRTAPAVRGIEPSLARSRAPQLGQRVSQAKAWHEQDGQAIRTPITSILQVCATTSRATRTLSAGWEWCYRPTAARISSFIQGAVLR